MSWKIIFSEKAKADFNSIYEYLAFCLLVLDTAANQVGRIIERISSLDEMPMRFRLYDNELWHSKGLRILPVDNYLVLYLPDKNNSTVNIVRILYGGMDIDNILSGGISR